jgi:hypothetical protein
VSFRCRFKRLFTVNAGYYNPRCIAFRRRLGCTDPAHPYQTFINGMAADISSTTISTAVPTTYTATDASGNTTTATRSVIVEAAASTTSADTLDLTGRGHRPQCRTHAASPYASCINDPG